MADPVLMRRSVREFTDDPVSDEDATRLVEAAMSAPSARNQQAWEFVVVDDPGLIAGLSGASPYAKPAGRAPLCIVPLGVREDMTVPMMWEQDMGAATENVLIAATSMGLGTCWIGIAPVEERMQAVREVLGVPEDRLPFCIIAVGHPRQPFSERPSRLVASRVHRNRYRSEHPVQQGQEDHHQDVHGREQDEVASDVRPLSPSVESERYHAGHRGDGGAEPTDVDPDQQVLPVVGEPREQRRRRDVADYLAHP